jgi:hypothetical protein
MLHARLNLLRHEQCLFLSSLQRGEGFAQAFAVAVVADDKADSAPESLRYTGTVAEPNLTKMCGPRFFLRCETLVFTGEFALFF